MKTYFEVYARFPVQLKSPFRVTEELHSLCRYYAESDPEDGHRLISLSADQVFAGSEVTFPAYWTEPEVMNSLEQSKSVVIQGFWYENNTFKVFLKYLYKQLGSRRIQWDLCLTTTLWFNMAQYGHKTQVNFKAIGSIGTINFDRK